MIVAYFYREETLNRKLQAELERDIYAKTLRVLRTRFTDVFCTPISRDICYIYSLRKPRIFIKKRKHYFNLKVITILTDLIRQINGSRKP